MALLNVVFSARSNHANAYRGNFLGVDDVDTSGSNALSDAAPADCFARCKAVGGDMYVISGGEAPDATGGVGMYLSDGEVVDLAVLEGWKVAVIDA